MNITIPDEMVAKEVIRLLASASLTIVEKPWGVEMMWTTDAFILKYIHVAAGHKTSMQYHREKHEVTLAVPVGDVGGERVIIYGDDYGRHVVPMEQPMHIVPYVTHQVVGPITMIEVTTLHNDDVVRVQDAYDR